MREIRMVDLQLQYDKIKTEVDKGIQEVIDAAAFINGGVVKEFQTSLEKYLHVKHVIPCGNGTDALQIAMMALGFKPGDEVITSNFTFVATVEVLCLLGLKPVLVDVDPKSFNMDIDQLKKKISSKTKAIVPVHVFGQCANMDEIMAVAKKHGAKVVEDVAQAIGAVYTSSDGTKKQAGTIGDIGCTSFFPSKNLGAFGDGGAIFTNDDKLAEKMRSIVNHGMGIRYHYNTIGINSRLDTIQAAILNVKLKHLDEYAAARNKAAQFYNRALEGVKELDTPFISPYTTHVFHQYTLKTKGIDRDLLQKKLAEVNIPSMIYYPLPLHSQEAYTYLGMTDNDFPVTLDLCKRVISLPMHTELSDDQLNYITENVKRIVREL